MGRQKRKVKPLPTIWEVSDELWNIIQAILDELDPPSWTGRDRIDQRAALNGIIYQMRSGCQWNHLPQQFGDDSSVHRTFQRWVQKGVLERIWATLVEDGEELGGVDWRWQSADGAMGKARLGGPCRPQPHRSGEKWHQTQCDRGGRRRSFGRSRGRCQHPRHETAAADH